MVCLTLYIIIIETARLGFADDEYIRLSVIIKITNGYTGADRSAVILLEKVALHVRIGVVVFGSHTCIFGRKGGEHRVAARSRKRSEFLSC